MGRRVFWDTSSRAAWALGHQSAASPFDPISWKMSTS
jgi:hypothetical protein